MVVVEAITLLISLVILAKSSSLVVEKALVLSRFFGISQLAVGFLLISVSTSLPELSVSIISSTVGEGALAAGNVFGSNIANILLVLGIGAFLYGFKVNKLSLKDIALVLVVTTIISAYMIFAGTVNRQVLGIVEGLILLLLFLGYAWYVLSNKVQSENGEAVISKREALNGFLFFAAGIIVVLVSAGLVVESGIKIARLFNLAESFIGATFIAIGTSLPELSIDLQAIRKKHYGMALGDAIGSNMVNLTLVLGAAAIINPITVTLPIFIAALLFAIVSNVILLYVASVKKWVGRTTGVAFLLLYLVYLASIFYLQLA